MTAPPFARWNVIVNPGEIADVLIVLDPAVSTNDGAALCACASGRQVTIGWARMVVDRYRLATAEERAASPWPCAAHAEADPLVVSLRKCADKLTQHALALRIDTGLGFDLECMRAVTDATNAAANAYRASRGAT